MTERGGPRPLGFEVMDRAGAARRGVVATAHGSFETPAFMPVGTAATVKGMDPAELEQAGAEVILGNTYHLFLRPGSSLVESFGGLHRFMGWQRPILTDSGGYQVMSLSRLRRIDDGGVTFRSHLDGSTIRLDPETVVRIQAELGSDIVMPLDVCPHYDEGEAGALRAVELTIDWLRRAVAAPRRCGQALFGIVQGGASLAARRVSLAATVELPVDGFAIGSVQVGEPKDVSYRVVEEMAAGLPPERPRYVMGVGTPADLVTMAAMGVDMFDTVLPTRNARNGMAFTSLGRVVIKNARHRHADEPLDPACRCSTCRRFSRAYLRHLFVAREILAAVLLTRHNVHFYLDLMRQIRDAISADSLDRLRDTIATPYA